MTCTTFGKQPQLKMILKEDITEKQTKSNGYGTVKVLVNVSIIFTFDCNIVRWRDYKL